MGRLYLILGIGVPEGYNSGEIFEYSFSDNIGFTIKVIEININSFTLNESRKSFAIIFDGFKESESYAIKIIDALYSIITFNFGFIDDEGLDIISVDTDLFFDGYKISFKDIIEHEKSKLDSNYHNETTLLNSIGGFKISKDYIDRSLKILNYALVDKKLFDSLQYYQKSLINTYFSPGEIHYLTTQEDEEPVRQIDITNYQDSLLNAYKAIEAIIGDPPSDDKKLKRKLIDLNIKPNQKLESNLRDEFNKTIIEKIRDINKARNKKSAHGGIRNYDRTITVLELIDYQFFTKSIIISYLESLQKKVLWAYLKKLYIIYSDIQTKI